MKSKHIQLVIAVIIGLACLYFFAQGKDWGEVWGAISHAHIGWILVSIAMGFVAMYIRAFRWQSFLGEPRVGTGLLFMIMNVGFMGNGVLPMRMGEFIRPILAGRLTPHKFSSALATIIVERVFDLMGILLCLSFVLMVYSFPETVPGSGEALTIEVQSEEGMTTVELTDDPMEMVQNFAWTAVLIFSVLFVSITMLTYAPQISFKLAEICFKPLPKGLSSKLLGMVVAFEEGASTFRRPVSFAYCLILTMLLWFAIAYSELVLLWAFDVNHISFTGALFIMVSLCFAVMFPQLPGYIGMYQLALTSVLVQLFHVDTDTSGAIAIVMWMCQIPPVIVAGFICLFIMGISFSEISQIKPKDPINEKIPSDNQPL